jgi:hypothetical protein
MNRQNDNISIKDVKYLNAEIIDFYPPQQKTKLLTFILHNKKPNPGIS